MRPTIRSLVAVLVLAPLMNAAGQAKGRVELTPFIGMYLPVADIINISDPTGSGLDLAFSQKSAFSLGGRLGYGLSDRAALEGAFGYTSSDVKIDVGGFGSVALGGTVLQGSARVLYRLNAPASPTAWHLVGGVAMISRGGEVWDTLSTDSTSVDGRTDFGVVIGGGVSLPVGKGLALRIDVEDYVYQAKFTFDLAGSRLDTESQLQNDLVLSVGLAIQLGGR
jgi:hypothetical protein